MTTGPEGIDVPAVTAWLAERVKVAPPLSFRVITGGRSNLTYLVTDAEGGRWILRRPPLHSVLPSAHDMRREHTVMAALADTPVPVPAMVDYEPDPSVTGAEFFVMEYVEGAVIRNAEGVEAHSPDVRRRVSESLVDVLAALHGVDPDGVGLGDFGKKQAYIARQLRRWRGQLEKGRQVHGARSLPVLDRVHERLVSDIPPQVGATVVHGDYRLDNLVLGPDGSIRAVLDWELSTLGDPMADLGMLAVYWTDPDETPLLPSQLTPTTAEGFLPRRALMRRYEERSGRDLGELDYYLAFGYWRLAVILEGVYSRYRSGAYGEAADETWEEFGNAVLELADRAEEAVGRAGR